MTDNELDEILERSKTPTPSPLLRVRALAEFRALKPRRRRRLWIPVLVLSGALLAFIGDAISETPSTIPAAWSIDSEFIRYAPDGSSIHEMDAISYELDGNEIVWSRSDPRSPLGGAVYRIADVMLPALSRAMQSGMADRVIKRQHGRAIGFVVGCGGGSLTRCLQIEHYFFQKNPDTCISGRVIGRAMILDHPTIGVQEELGDSLRLTLWMAPDLGCFALKAIREYRFPDGVFHLESDKRAFRISGQTK